MFVYLYILCLRVLLPMLFYIIAVVGGADIVRLWGTIITLLPRNVQHIHLIYIYNIYTRYMICAYVMIIGRKDRDG